MVIGRHAEAGLLWFRRSALAPLLIALALGLGGCAIARDWQQTDLYFAIGRVGESAAGETVWRHFIETDVIPRFPAGFTIVPAIGTWRAGGSAPPPELDSRVLVILHPPSHEADERIEDIRRAWRALTGAESVLRADHAARVSF